jgi:hypothetical protein
MKVLSVTFIIWVCYSKNIMCVFWEKPFSFVEREERFGIASNAVQVRSICDLFFSVSETDLYQPP